MSLAVPTTMSKIRGAVRGRRQQRLLVFCGPLVKQHCFCNDRRRYDEALRLFHSSYTAITSSRNNRISLAGGGVSSMAFYIQQHSKQQWRQRQLQKSTFYSSNSNNSKRNTTTNNSDSITTTSMSKSSSAVSSTSFLVESFQNMVKEGKATNDKFQLQALNVLDELRNDIITKHPDRYTKKYCCTQNNNKIIQSLGDSEEMEVPSYIKQSLMQTFNSLFATSTSISSNNKNDMKGVYLHGGVGCGKTFCMNLFYESLVLPNNHNNNNNNDTATTMKRATSISKQKVHFHSFMLNIHKQMHEAKMIHKVQGDVLPHIIHKTIQNGIIICFDEFQVTDVADALILRRLFTGLLEKGAIIVATSNRPPSDLYLNGLQRDLFLPFIDLLNQTLHVVSMWESDVDYRLIQGENKARGVYFVDKYNGDGDGDGDSNDNIERQPQQGLSDAKLEFEKAFHTLTKTNNNDTRTGTKLTTTGPTTLTTQGRQVKIPQASLEYGVARFTFNDLCRQARGAADYLLIGQHFHTVFVEDIPALTMNDVNLVRRFIIFVDSMYESHVKLIIHAHTDIDNIFKVDLDNQHCDEAFAFDRTRSRLEEMGSDEYLKRRWNKSKTKL